MGERRFFRPFCFRGSDKMSFQPVKKAKKGILNIVFSRASMVILLLVMQIAIFAMTITRLYAYANYIHIVFALLKIVSVIFIINSKSNPDFKITWILLIFLLPFLFDLQSKCKEFCVPL